MRAQMSTPGRTGWTWLIAGAGSIVVLGVIFGLFRKPGAESPKARRATAAAVLPDVLPPVRLVVGAEGAADKLLKEETMLRDPTPLFLPTAWNAAETGLPADLQREPGAEFRNYPARLQFGEAELKLNLPAAVPIPEHPAEGLALDKPERPLGGFGETDASVAALETRGGFVEVTGAADGRVMLAESLRLARPPGEGNWQPLEFLVTVDAIGLVQPPVLTESSRVAAVDNYFQDYLGNGLHIGERLPPGFYRVAIGP